MTDAHRLDSRTVLVTGGAVRVGAAISTGLAAAGARLAIHCHSHRDQAEHLAAAIIEAGGEARVVQADLAEPTAVAAVFDEVEAAIGPVDTLVNNAAILTRTPLARFDAAAAARLMRINLLAPLATMAELARRAPAQGAIVNVVDAAADKGWVDHAAYVASKAGLLAASRVAAAELAPDIRVNVVNPGTVLLREDERAHLDQLLERIPLARIGTPEHIAAAVLFLLTNDYTTGTVLNVDGGAGLP